MMNTCLWDMCLHSQITTPTAPNNPNNKVMYIWKKLIYSLYRYSEINTYWYFTHLWMYVNNSLTVPPLLKYKMQICL